jgi:acyl dehydratase
MSGARVPGARWEAGEELEEIELEPITRLDLIKYAGASGDYNPIHTVDESAHESGLPGIIAHGMLTAATLGRLFSPHLAHGYVGSLDVRFTGMVRLGDTLRVGGKATGLKEAKEVKDGMEARRGLDRFTYGFEVYARTPLETVITGTAEFVEPIVHEAG